MPFPSPPPAKSPVDGSLSYDTQETRDTVNADLTHAYSSDPHGAQVAPDTQALKREMLRQQPYWWHGRRFHCAQCDVIFTTPREAAQHVITLQHPVLRVDLERDQDGDQPLDRGEGDDSLDGSGGSGSDRANWRGAA